MNGYLRRNILSPGNFQFATNLFSDYIISRIRSHSNGTIVGYGVIDVPKKTPFREKLKTVF